MIGDARWDALPDQTKRDRRAEGPALLAELRSARSEPAYDPTMLTVPVVAGCGTRSKEHHQWSAHELVRLTRSGELFVIEGADHGAHVSRHADFATFTRRVVERRQ
jgi:pimeloyl-ACP methyl ester carboxylesterase